MTESVKIVNFRFTRAEVAEWDRFAREKGMNRTNLFRRAVNDYLQSKGDTPVNGDIERLISANASLKNENNALKEAQKKSSFESAKSAITRVGELEQILKDFGDISKHPVYVNMKLRGFTFRDFKGNSQRVKTLPELMDYLKNRMGI